MLPRLSSLLQRILLIAACSLQSSLVLAQADSFRNFQNSDSYSVRAQLVAVNKTILSAGITGQISAVHYNVGEPVETGGLLLEFDCAALEAQQKMYAAQQNIGRINMDVKKRLFDLNNIGLQELDLSRAEFDSASAQVDVIDVELERCQLRAPFSGLIVERAVEPYQYVSEGTEMLELLSVSELEVLLVTPSSWLPWLEVDEDFELVVDEIGQSFAGKVTRLGGRVDPVSQTFLVYGALTETSEKLLPGMSGNIFFNPDE